MSNFIVTQLTLNNYQYGKILKPLASNGVAFDLNLAVPVPKTLPEYSEVLLLSLAHHLQSIEMDQVQLEEIADQLDTHIDDADDFEDLADRFAELLAESKPGEASRLLQMGVDALGHLRTYGAICSSDWKRVIWGDDVVESVQVKGRVITLYSRSSLLGFAMAWANSLHLDLSIASIDSGCHNCVVAEYLQGKQVAIHRNRHKDLKALSQSLLGYTSEELI